MVLCSVLCDQRICLLVRMQSVPWSQLSFSASTTRQAVRFLQILVKVFEVMVLSVFQWAKGVGNEMFLIVVDSTWRPRGKLLAVGHMYSQNVLRQA